MEDVNDLIVGVAEDGSIDLEEMRDRVIRLSKYVKGMRGVTGTAGQFVHYLLDTMILLKLTEMGELLKPITAKLQADIDQLVADEDEFVAEGGEL